jgi:hypothetical protein
MTVNRRAAVCLCCVTLMGASAATRRDVAAGFGHHICVPADVGVISGTIVHTAASKGFVTMDWRSPIVAPYRGGAITLEEAAHAAAFSGSLS